MSRPPSRSLTLIVFGAAGNVPLTTFSQVTCAEVAPVVPLRAPCDLVPRCLLSRRRCLPALVAHAYLDHLPFEVTFSILCSDAGVSRMTRRTRLDVTLPRSSAGP